MEELKFNPERLQVAMKAAKIGNTELARRAGISRQMVYLLREGARPSVSAEIIGKLAKELDVTVAYLMGSSAQEEQPPIQKLPEAVRQLAEIAAQLSDMRREELRRIAATLHKFEQEQGKLPADPLEALIQLVDKLEQENGDDGDVVEALRAHRALRKVRDGGAVNVHPPAPHQGTDSPS